MASAFEDFILSPQFTFFVGEDAKPIVVHAAAIAATSHQLDALINGGMQESDNGCAKIEDVRVEDFVRFCEYAYRGDYTVPPWEEAPPQPSSTSNNTQQNGIDDSWGSSGVLSKKEMKKMKKVRASIEPAAEPEPEPEPSWGASVEPGMPEVSHWETMLSRKPPVQVRSPSRTPLRAQLHTRNYLDDSHPRALILQHFKPKPNSTVNQNFTPVFLAHARLYCFAHVRLIAPLQALTLDKLHKTLLNFKLYSERVGDIIELSRYAYANPDLPDRSADGTPNDLRKLVVDYIVCEIDTIGKHDEFVQYMEEGGEFVGDFWRLARNHVA